MRFCVIVLILSFAFVDNARSENVKWRSQVTGTELSGVVSGQTSDKPVATIVYLKNLSIPRIGQERDESIIGDFEKSGYIVLVLDYQHDPKAVSPQLNLDMLKLRTDIGDAKRRTLLTDYPVDVNRLYILCEGCRIKRDVEFARDGDRVLGMDIIYPSKPSKKVPVLMEITCDNKDRFGSFSLLFCHDTLVEGAAAAGFAAAMVDHPVPPPYKGIDDPMQQSIERMEAAVKMLRAQANELGTSDKVGAIGFSRGGPFAAVLAAKGDVNAALIHGNRYDYLDLLPKDPMIPRFQKVWGKAADNKDKWAEHGASIYLTKNSSPMFLNTSNAESPEYQDGLAKFDKRLTELGIEHVYQVDEDGRGHRVSTEPKTLGRIYEFFATYLKQ
jgi:dienelactone hydrolase